MRQVYPGPMARKPGEEAPRPPAQDERPAEAGAVAGERVGPLILSRHVKPDGRALLLYTRVEQSPP